MLMRSILVSLVLAAASCAPPAAPVTAEDVQARYEAGQQSYETAIAAFERTAPQGAAYDGDLAPLADYLRAAMRQTRDAQARERAAVYLATLMNYRTAVTVEDFNEIIAAAPAASAEWARDPQNAIRRVAEELPAETARPFLQALVRDNAERAVKAWALVRLAELERREGNMDAYAETYAQVEPYMDVEGLRFPIRLLNPANSFAVGKEAPAFALRELGTDRIVTSESLRGRYVLLDFWATWCAPCIVERDQLVRAQERFGGDRFTIVSISVDNRAEDAIQFRERRWAMPWLNLFAPGSHYSEEDFGFGGDVAQAYEITWTGVPQLILVSPEGRILAVRDQLDGPALERTLSRYLDAPA